MTHKPKNKSAPEQPVYPSKCNKLQGNPSPQFGFFSIVLILLHYISIYVFSSFLSIFGFGFPFLFHHLHFLSVVFLFPISLQFLIIFFFIDFPFLFPTVLFFSLYISLLLFPFVLFFYNFLYPFIAFVL